MPSVNIAASLEAVSNAALQAMLPNGVTDGRLATKQLFRDGHVAPQVVVRGTLPSGLEWECPLDIDMQAVYYANDGAWLASTELARELKKAAHAFKVMVALEGARPPRCHPMPCSPFKVGESVRDNGGVTAYLSVRLPIGSKQLTTKLADLSTGAMLVQLDDVPSLVTGPLAGGQFDYGFTNLRSGIEYRLDKLSVVHDGGAQCNYDPCGAVRFKTQKATQAGDRIHGMNLDAIEAHQRAAMDAMSAGLERFVFPK